MSDSLLYELELLLLEWEDGSLPEEGVARIREILNSGRVYREHFAKWQVLSASLHLESTAPESRVPEQDRNENIPARESLFAELVEPGQRSERPLLPGDGQKAAEPAAHPPGGHAVRTGRSGLTARRLLALAAAGLLVMLGVRWLQLESWRQNSSGRPTGTETAASTTTNVNGAVRQLEPTSQGHAIVTRLFDAGFTTGSHPITVGDLLQTGPFRLDSGVAQIEFFCGATVVLEGPAELNIDSAKSATIKQGKLRAQVPPAARGFALKVDDTHIVDLGTEFGLAVSPQGVEVQVFDGEVEIQQSGEDVQLVRAGQAFAGEKAANLLPTAPTRQSFIDLAALASDATNVQAENYRRWQAYSQQVRRDTRLLAYYSFEQDKSWQRKLESSLIPSNSELDGAIVGARRAVGRWPAKGALEFKHPADRVRVEIPGEFSSLTFACWAKIDSLDRWYNSLFLTDSYEQGEPHWQILDTGQLFFSVRVREGSVGQEHREVLSPAFWEPSMSGMWLHLATVYDVANATTTHYLNGRMLSEEKIPPQQLVKATRIGLASIGNWSTPTRKEEKFAIRNLNGSIDEFAIYDAALTTTEIQQLYERGKP